MDGVLKNIGRFILLFRKHSPHHIAGVLSMVCNGADNFSQPDQIYYGNGIYFHAKNLLLNNIFEFIDFTFLLVQCVNYILNLYHCMADLPQPKLLHTFM